MHVYYGTFGSSRAQRLDKDFGLLPPHGPGLTQPSILKIGKSSTSLSGWGKGGVCSLVSGGR